MTGFVPESTPTSMAPLAAVVDIELTSRCNAKCTFCPRDQTPHQGLIDDATFAAALGRAVEYRDALIGFQQRAPGYFETHDDTIWLSFCGMGDPLLHPRAAEYVARVADAGLRPIINTNASLLTPGTAAALLDAGLQMACLNVGEIDDQYEAVYGLPFERTRDNVEHFLEVSPGRCIPVIVLVDHRGDPEHTALVRDFWSERGATAFMPFDLVNRAGSLSVGDQVDAWRVHGEAAASLFRAHAVDAKCWVPFLYPFIGYDGTYYLCSSDWHKDVDLGNVFDHALVDLLDEKLAQVTGSSPICRGCTHEPSNAIAQMVAAAPDHHPGEPVEVTPAIEMRLAALSHYNRCIDAMRSHLPRTPRARPEHRRLIPVRS